MDRTKRAALLAAVIVAGTIGGLGGFLGFPPVGSIITGLVLGCLAGLLLIAAGRRAETFHPTDPNAHLADPTASSADPADPTADLAAQDRAHRDGDPPGDLSDTADEHDQRPDDTPGA
ncbi:MAG: hypothetical protein EA388_03370 [Nitriliruptor sp.]|nr:MAG: hypothetical protein EA388_03370 [Nitriliruptor sp.]